MVKTLTTQLRFGWTTGTCATAATYGAYMALVTGDFPQTVTIVTPSGKTAELSLSFYDIGSTVIFQIFSNPVWVIKNILSNIC